MRVPTAIFEKLHRVVLNVLGWHTRKMNSKEALRAALYLIVATIYLGPGLLNQHRPKDFFLGAAKGRLLSCLIDRQVVIHDD